MAARVPGGDSTFRRLTGFARQLGKGILRQSAPDTFCRGFIDV